MKLTELYQDLTEQFVEQYLTEAGGAVMAWGKSGKKIIKKYRCKSGPKAGRLVSEPQQCSRRVDPEKRMKMKRLLAKMGKRMTRKAKRTKQVDPISKQVKRKNEILNNKIAKPTPVKEGMNILGSSIHLNTVPEKYRKLKLIGRGTTSLVFELNQDEVIILTRDEMKNDWLQHSNLAQYIETLELTHPKQSMANKPVYVLKMPKLIKLDSKNKKIIKAVQNLYDKQNQIRGSDYHTFINRLTEEIEKFFHDQESLKDFMSFISNYDQSQYSFDFLERNFMQDTNGKIIATDPVVSQEILNIFYDIRSKKYNKGGW